MEEKTTVTTFDFEFGRATGLLQGHELEMSRLRNIMHECKCNEQEGECPFKKDGLCRLDGKIC